MGKIRQTVRDDSDDIFALGGVALPPEPEDDQYKYAWLRVFIQGGDDTKNIANKLASGWEFVKPDMLPDSIRHRYPKRILGQLTGVVGVDDVALARLPLEVHQRRRMAVEKYKAEQVAAFNREFRGDSNSPYVTTRNNSETRVKTGPKAMEFAE